MPHQFGPEDNTCHHCMSVLYQHAAEICSLTFIKYRDLLVRARGMNEGRGNLFQIKIILTNSSDKILENQVLRQKYNLTLFLENLTKKKKGGGRQEGRADCKQTVKFKSEERV